MYEIYINDRPLRLISASDVQQHQSNDPLHLLARYSGKIKTLLNYADLLEKASPKVAAVTLFYPNLDQLWNDFLTHYKIISAAGGIVQLQETDKYLFIFRRNYLDLPKGKIDPGETPEQAAIREVQEETGLDKVALLPPPANQLPGYPLITYHTYRSRKSKRILKPTYWYPMRTSQIELVPQKEEDIEWARWMSLQEARSGNWLLYENLGNLIRQFTSADQ